MVGVGEGERPGVGMGMGMKELMRSVPVRGTGEDSARGMWKEEMRSVPVRRRVVGAGER